MKTYKNIIYIALKPYGAILFLNNKFAALSLLLITFINPSVAITGIVAIIFTIIIAELIALKEAYLSQGF
jgi:urea transporter